MAEAFDILLWTDEVLNVSILPRSPRENGIINDNTVDRLIGVGIDDFLLNILFLYCLKTELEATE